MNCLSDNQLQAFLDEEGTELEKAQIALHLEQCQFCQAAYERLQENNLFCKAHIGNYQETVWAETSIKPTARIIPIENHHNKNRGVTKTMKTYKKYLMTACALGLVVMGFTVEPVRAAVGDAVSIFRAQDIKTVDISLNDLKELEQSLAKQEGSIDIENLAKIKQNGSENKKITKDEAQGSVNYPLSSLAGLEGVEPTEVNLVTNGQMDFTLNIANVNQLMKTLGAEKLFDESLDGKTFSLYTPGTISMSYELGTKENSKYVSYTQSKFPEITAPEGTNVQDLVASIASLGILPSELQSKLKSMTDLEKTLYLPNVNGMLEPFEVAGQTYYGQFETGEYAFANVIWMENGVVKAVTGNFNKVDFEKMIKGDK